MSETLTQTKDRIIQIITETAPTIDVAPGSVFNELLAGTEAAVQNYVQNDVLSLAAGKTISAALNSAVDTYDPIIDSIASNYNVTRNQSSISTGVIRVTLSQNSSAAIGANTTFIEPLLNYTYSNTATFSPTLIATIINNQNFWYFDMPVVASSAGAEKTVSDGTPFELQVPLSIPYFVSAKAVGSFNSGKNAETDKELIARFRAGMSVKNMSSADAITNQLQTTFASFQSTYLADHNNALNLRAADNPLQLKMPGCVDIYLRNSVALQSVSFVVDTSISYVGDSYIFDITPAVTPNFPEAAYGFYKILSVELNPGAVAGEQQKLPFSVVYGIAPTTYNNVQTIKEARFTVYQSATVKVKHDSVSTPSFLVTVLAPVGLQSVQNLFNDPATRLPNADYLAKGVVPCIVGVNISLVAADPTTFDIVALKGDIFSYINGLGVGEPVVLSRIVNLCHKYNVKQVHLPIVVRGQVFTQYYTNAYGDVVDYIVQLDGTDKLTIPDMSELGFTSKNVAFFTNYYSSDVQENIVINVQ